jgi:hypothetical protein
MRAEHEISYSAKRAIERFLGLPDDGVDEVAFMECAKAHSLCEGEVEKCKALLAEFRIWRQA